jgi:hypothetical protein
MQWTMPPRVLQIVAGLIGLAATAAFVMGVVSAPQRGGRLPGAKVPGAAAGSTAIEATDATPLSDERIEGPPPAENDAVNDENNSTEADAGNATAAAAADAPAAQPAPPKPAQPPVIAVPPPPQTLGGPPTPDEPPH